jgi:hypothetical protein
MLYNDNVAVLMYYIIVYHLFNHRYFFYINNRFTK